MFDNAVLTRFASAQPNLFRDLQALSWSHGFHARSREHGALWNRSGRRTRRRYPRTRTGALDLSPLITHEFPLTQVEAALDAVRSRAGLKVAVRPGRDKPTEC